MLLSRDDLGRLRAQTPEACTFCMAALSADYCRDHDEFFDRGHGAECVHRSVHEPCHSYDQFDATVETDVHDLTVAYVSEATRRGFAVEGFTPRSGWYR
jgi:hypothetical protein